MGQFIVVRTTAGGIDWEGRPQVEFWGLVFEMSGKHPSADFIKVRGT